MPTILTFLLRLFLLAAGLLLAASAAVGAILLLAVWGVRAGWARLTGKPLTPFAFRIDPRSGFERMYRRAGQQRRNPSPGPMAARRNIADVTDVEARPQD